MVVVQWAFSPMLTVRLRVPLGPDYATTIGSAYGYGGYNTGIGTETLTTSFVYQYPATSYG